MKHLELVCDRVKRAGLKLKPENRQLARPETVYLGHVADGIKPDPKKTEAVQSFATECEGTEIVPRLDVLLRQILNKKSQLRL